MNTFFFFHPRPWFWSNLLPFSAYLQGKLWVRYKAPQATTLRRQKKVQCTSTALIVAYALFLSLRRSRCPSLLPTRAAPFPSPASCDERSRPQGGLHSGRGHASRKSVFQRKLRRKLPGDRAPRSKDRTQQLYQGPRKEERPV